MRMVPILAVRRHPAIGRGLTNHLSRYIVLYRTNLFISSADKGQFDRLLSVEILTSSTLSLFGPKHLH